MAISTGQITIVDYNDALTLTGYITSSQPKTQQYNPDNATYSPSWAAANCILTPSLFKLGTAADIIADAAVTSVKWYEMNAGVATLIATDSNYTVGTSGAKPLTIKTNVMTGSVAAKDYLCEITYRDASTGLDLVHKISISFNKVINGGGIADAVCWCPKGNVFKNDSVPSLTIHCDLWRGSMIDTTLVTYEWFQQDATIGADQGGGVGWKKLSDTANKVTGTATNEITIFPNQVLTYGVFKCKITDTDSSSNTYNTSYYDTATIADQSDPFQVSILSTGGETFKNGVGSSTLTAKLFQAGAEVDAAGTKYSYTWTIYNQSGVLSTFNGGAASKTGKSITVGDLDVTVKATFVVTVDTIA